LCGSNISACQPWFWISSSSDSRTVPSQLPLVPLLEFVQVTYERPTAGLTQNAATIILAQLFLRKILQEK
jgi:hypothetical protein